MKRSLAVYIVIPLGAVLLTAGCTDTARPSSTRTTSLPPPTSSISPSSSRSSIPSAPPRSSKQSSHPSSRPAIKPLTMADVVNGTWVVPAWASGSSCPSGRFSFHAGTVIWQTGDPTKPNGGPPFQSEFDVRTGAGSSYSEDVNGDGTPDLLVLLYCGGHQPLATSVVALTRDSRGAIATIGTVISLPTPARDLRGEVDRIEHGSGGLVNVTVDDTYAGRAPTAYQTRRFRLRDGHFVQVSGPTTFPPH